MIYSTTRSLKVNTVLSANADSFAIEGVILMVTLVGCVASGTSASNTSNDLLIFSNII